jgi:hypothetical protein
MTPTKPKIDALGYLLGGVGLLAISYLPLLTLGMGSVVQPIGKLVIVSYWLLGGVGLWWAVRRFTAVGERVAALVGVVIGWYVLFQLLMVLETMVFRF